MKTKLTKIHCEYCNFTKVYEGECNLYTYTRSPVFKKYSKDPQTYNTMYSHKEQAAKVRCPGCGRPISAKNISDTQQELNKKLDAIAKLERIQQEKVQLETELEKRVEENRKRIEDVKKTKGRFDGGETSTP